jgi:hypothetical protein
MEDGCHPCGRSLETTSGDPDGLRTLERDVQDTEDDSAGGTAGTRRGAAVRRDVRGSPRSLRWTLWCTCALRVGDCHPFRGATPSPAPSRGPRWWRHQHPVDGVSIRTMSRAWCVQHCGRPVGTVDTATAADQSGAWLFRLRPAERTQGTLGANEWSEVRLTPSSHQCHHGHPFGRVSRRARGSISEITPAATLVVVAHFEKASGQGACSHHVRGSFGVGRAFCRPNRRPPGHRTRSFGFERGRWVGDPRGLRAGSVVGSWW